MSTKEKPRGNKKENGQSQQEGKRGQGEEKRRQPAKLNVDEDADGKNILVKVARQTGVRQLIQYLLEHLPKDKVVAMTAFSIDIHKILEAAEVAKTRLQFLHQENSFIFDTREVHQRQRPGGEESKEGEAATETRDFAGLRIVLSKVPFDLTHPTGYQRPKPRQFVTGQNQRPRPQEKEPKESEATPKQEKEEPAKAEPKNLIWNSRDFKAEERRKP